MRLHVHRDLKLENILVVPSGDGVVLADFGLARLVPDGPVRMTTAQGTMDIRAPEVDGHAGYGTKADVWSMGAVLLQAHLVGSGAAARWRPPLEDVQMWLVWEAAALTPPSLLTLAIQGALTRSVDARWDAEDVARAVALHSAFIKCSATSALYVTLAPSLSIAQGPSRMLFLALSDTVQYRSAGSPPHPGSLMACFASSAECAASPLYILGVTYLAAWGHEWADAQQRWKEEVSDAVDIVAEPGPRLFNVMPKPISLERKLPDNVR